jgi:hypothetical protein
MSCTNCGNKSRYKDMINDKDGVGDVEQRVYNEQSFKELNNMSFEDLETMKKGVDSSFYESFINSFSNMSDSLKTFQLINLIDVVNGERFSPQGYSPKYCIKLLNTLLSLDSFSFAQKKFPNLKGQVEKLFSEIQRNKIVL